MVLLDIADLLQSMALARAHKRRAVRRTTKFNAIRCIA
jgi:hypothetical protein